MKVLVCGGRNFGNLIRGLNRDEQPPGVLEEYEFIQRTLEKLCLDWPRTPEDEYGNWLPDVTIISGGAKGVDSAAIDWAIVNWTQFEEYKADWDWKKYGPSAGPIRNQRMIDEGKPDLVVAFPGGKGTADMVARAKKAGIPVKEIEWNNTNNTSISVGTQGIETI